MLTDFLSVHSFEEKIVSIEVEPEILHFEEIRNSNFLNFDFVISGLY
ncbi:unnamed protein product [marine sediment metagenome]|uniref:Uncharacterized protein n=1 Tax=marine sediment metagenome TaxID=412755 RepID=X1IGL9_9ZZZZ